MYLVVCAQVLYIIIIKSIQVVVVNKLVLFILPIVMYLTSHLIAFGNYMVAMVIFPTLMSPATPHSIGGCILLLWLWPQST